ncbi:hypothetical protein BN7_5901 [Wickerhamomyces ciferrii]|uniref:Uncharacterized protein n=1 Tax=Wickerhamomyces ciferrii (strain ATCC 14091 / BCRC 22168 / CBS 111 / JCM 3599 / NBRC 0793 / NRRL Y-1031 F-60-10) TaxID=1206466 RepID=K0KXY9_WICCF|nr:uncharacterized protein BN7_5901 [Wickerhamomyces ciferrii]CCH46309.1 hypothetical protein BN7_5901 [Wickerhamomyces ciferrii]
MLRAQKTLSLVGRRGIKTVHKELKFSNSARIAVLQGASKVYKAVSATLGPKGRNVLMEQKYNAPKITKDGYSIAQELSFEDRFENMGCQLLKDVTNRSNLESGDGTTTSTVLAYNILSNSLRHVSTGANPTEVRNGVQLAINKVIEFLETQKEEVTSNEQMKQIAVVSSNGDEKLGELIAQAVEQVGKDGIVTIESGNKLEDELIVSKGLRFDRGFIVPQFGNLSKPSSKVELENPLILLHKGELRNAQQILPTLSHAQRAKRSLLIITEDMIGDALAISILNKVRGQVNVIAVKAPGFGAHRDQYFLDLEAATGSKIVDTGAGDVASTATRHHFGSASSVTVSPNETTIIGGNGEQSKIDERIELIRNAIEDDKTSISDYDQLKIRLSKLTGGAAIIKPGGVTQFEVKEKKDRLDDALNSTYSALQSGFLPGGGVALLKASFHLKKQDFNNESFDTKLGINVVQSALASPFTKILENSGIESGHLKSKVDNGSFSFGVNAQTGELVDMYEDGIIDPYATIRSALTNASGVTSLLSTTEVAITSVLGEKEGF